MSQVKVTGGLVEGELVNGEYTGPYYSFKGIPFAEPPIGDLRFQAPQPVKPWIGVRNAKVHGPACPQIDILFKTTEITNEDCLYLNVYTPKLSLNNLLPVMVWIHGGGLFCGSGHDTFYGPEFLISHDVVLVTFNYRIDALGFLSLDTEEIPGNAGFKDQVAALRWVRENIKEFGGDADNVTIFGESAGGLSVALHLISPMSKGLFKRAILQSGVSTNPWSIIDNARERALMFARNLGCKSKNDKEIASFFKSLPSESLVGHRVPITLTEKEKDFPMLYFGAIPEKKFGNSERFLTDDIKPDHIHEGVEVIAGNTEHEGLVFFSLIRNMDQVVNQANEYLEYFVSKPLALKCSVEQQLEIGKKVKEFYVKEGTVSKSNIEPVLKYFAFSFFTFDVIEWAQNVSMRGQNKVYFYKFACKSKVNKFSEIFEAFNEFKSEDYVSHADDILYLFNNKNSKINLNSEEYYMIQRMTKLWTNFAKYGHPTPDKGLGVTWPEFDMKKQTYLKIGNQLAVENYPDKEEVEFWQDIFNTYLSNSV